MIITGRRFTQIGEALFGPTKWFAVLGQMVDKDYKTISRYSERGRIPVELRGKLADICDARGDALKRLAEELRA